MPLVRFPSLCRFPVCVIAQSVHTTIAQRESPRVDHEKKKRKLSMENAPAERRKSHVLSRSSVALSLARRQTCCYGYMGLISPTFRQIACKGAKKMRGTKEKDRERRGEKQEKCMKRGRVEPTPFVSRSSSLAQPTSTLCSPGRQERRYTCTSQEDRKTVREHKGKNLNSQRRARATRRGCDCSFLFILLVGNNAPARHRRRRAKHRVGSLQQVQHRLRQPCPFSRSFSPWP